MTNRASAASVSAVRSHGLPRRVLPERCLPALSLLPGQSAVQLARWSALGMKTRRGTVGPTGKIAAALIVPVIGRESSGKASSLGDIVPRHRGMGIVGRIRCTLTP